jgi:kelch-like protein 1/4/5
MRKMETCAGKRQLCDVVLIAGNKRLPAHRLVLSAASDYFAAMFMNNVREASMAEVELKDVDPEALDALVHYMYTGRLGHSLHVHR